MGVFGFRTIRIVFPVWALLFLSFENRNVVSHLSNVVVAVIIGAMLYLWEKKNISKY